MPSNSRLAYSAVVKALFSHPAWILTGTLFVFVFTQIETSLFGLIRNEPLQGFLSFSPYDPWREWGLTLFTYPLVHSSFEHWAINSFLWLIFGTKLSREIEIKKFYQELLALGFYALLSLMIALTYLLPMAPTSTEHDRILGLSATVFFQIGFLLRSGKNSLLWFFLIALGITYGYFGAGSALALWGHAAGFLIGIILGQIYKKSR